MNSIKVWVNGEQKFWAEGDIEKEQIDMLVKHMLGIESMRTGWAFMEGHRVSQLPDLNDNECWKIEFNTGIPVRCRRLVDAEHRCSRPAVEGTNLCAAHDKLAKEGLF